MDEINKKLTEAFSKILNEKISVTLLCKKAGVARATFYLRFSDINDFLEKNRRYLVKKLFEQMKLILTSSDQELFSLCKEENLLLDKTDRKLLDYFAGGNKYIDFTWECMEDLIPLYEKLCLDSFGEEFYEKNKQRFKYFLNGITPTMFLALVNYDQETFLYEMRMCRSIGSKILNF